MRPSTYSITMYGTGTPVDMSSPVSYTATIDGLFSDAADCASRRKRAWKVWSLARSVRRVLMATTRSSRMSRARYTSAMPPRPTTPFELVPVTEQPGLCHVSHSSKPPCIVTIIRHRRPG